jgi:hypothetical protein
MASVDDEPDMAVLFHQQFRRDLRSGRFVMELPSLRLRRCSVSLTPKAPH